MTDEVVDAAEIEKRQINYRVGALVDCALSLGRNDVIIPGDRVDVAKVLEDNNGNHINVKISTEEMPPRRFRPAILQFHAYLAGSKAGNTLDAKYSWEGADFKLNSLDIHIPAHERKWSFPRVAINADGQEYFPVDKIDGSPLKDVDFFCKDLDDPVVRAEIRSRLAHLEQAFITPTSAL